MFAAFRRWRRRRTIERAVIQRYKNQGGWNNDWELSQRMCADLGVAALQLAHAGLQGVEASLQRGGIGGWAHVRGTVK